MTQATDNPNPYLNARQEWLERYGDYIAEAARWRRIALITSLAALVSVGGVIHLATRSKFVPYIVEVDKHGYQATSYAVAPGNARDPKVVKAFLSEWIGNVRRVSADGGAETEGIKKAFTFLDSQDPVKGMVVEYLKTNSPFERAKYELVSVQVDSVVLVAPDRYVIEWIESIKDRGGKEKESAVWQASVTLRFVDKAITDETVASNPLGMQIVALDWSKKKSMK